MYGCHSPEPSRPRRGVGVYDPRRPPTGVVQNLEDYVQRGKREEISVGGGGGMMGGLLFFWVIREDGGTEGGSREMGWGG